MQFRRYEILVTSECRVGPQATVGLTDRIFTRVESQEAAAVGRSQFMMDLCQVASMLRLATARCVSSPRS